LIPAFRSLGLQTQTRTENRTPSSHHPIIPNIPTSQHPNIPPTAPNKSKPKTSVGCLLPFSTAASTTSGRRHVN
jgi:hypothetical protein